MKNKKKNIYIKTLILMKRNSQPINQFNNIKASKKLIIPMKTKHNKQSYK